EEYKEIWNKFLLKSKNGTFLFHRDYIGYHSSRFNNIGLMFKKKGSYRAMIPLNISDKVAWSHQGITYGGFLFSKDISIQETILIFNQLNEYLRNRNIAEVYYKPLPYIYHTYSSQEDLYALFRLNAQIIGRNISSTIVQSAQLKFTESRLSGLRKGLRLNFQICKEQNFKSFWNILEQNLQSRYGTLPVHTCDEIEQLYLCFPENIILHTVKNEDQVLCGCVIFKSTQVVHVQYISATPEGRQLGALDILFDNLINKEYVQTPFFDLGSSNEEMGKFLNTSLIFQKKVSGGRGVC
ncbi:MAG: GNAT family N-acetyltransferase, partial [Bacteroidetes bacterium]|nr:GNAT family N-acetyltransferase [Bacteroidota bacterium]